MDKLIEWRRLISIVFIFTFAAIPVLQMDVHAGDKIPLSCAKHSHKDMTHVAVNVVNMQNSTRPIRFVAYTFRVYSTNENNPGEVDTDFEAHKFTTMIDELPYKKTKTFKMTLAGHHDSCHTKVQLVTRRRANKMVGGETIKYIESEQAGSVPPENRETKYIKKITFEIQVSADETTVTGVETETATVTKE